MTAHLSLVHIGRLMQITVVVPSYRRRQDLARCLAALRVQRRAPNTVVVALRPEDEAARALVDELALSWSTLQSVLVDGPGVIAAMSAGIAHAVGDVVALTDDDAEPMDDWLERIVAHFEARPEVGGVGGRDDQAGVTGSARTVGRVQWFGRIIGNHHIGVGASRDVDVLKGVNCAFRLDAIRRLGFDTRLHGVGAQVHWELALCLGLRRAGWRLTYDPAIRVRHHVSIRHDADQLHRGRFDAAPHEDAVFNETLALVEHFSATRRMAFMIWSGLIGTAAEPGLFQLPRMLAREGGIALRRYQATRRGRFAGWRAARESRPAALEPGVHRGLT